MNISFRRAQRITAIFLLCIFLIACGASAVQKIVSKSNSVAQNINSLDPAGQLLAEGLIDEAEAEMVRKGANDFLQVYNSFDSDLTALVKANPKASLAAVAPAFAKALLRFNELRTIKFKNPKAQIRYEQILGVARLGMAFISAFFDTKLKEAEGFLRESQPEVFERARLALAGVPYDAARIKRARDIIRSGGDDAGARAVCDYLSIAYDEEQVKAIRLYASMTS